MAGSGVEFSPMELFALKQEDLERSLIYLGKDPLSQEQASSIWKALIKVSLKRLIFIYTSLGKKVK
jgi:hypothetical protein